MNVCIGGVVGFAAVMAFLLCMCRAAAWADEARDEALRKMMDGGCSNDD